MKGATYAKEKSQLYGRRKSSGEVDFDKFTYTSSNPKDATVSATGVVTSVYATAAYFSKEVRELRQKKRRLHPSRRVCKLLTSQQQRPMLSFSLPMR